MTRENIPVPYSSRSRIFVTYIYVYTRIHICTFRTRFAVNRRVAREPRESDRTLDAARNRERGTDPRLVNSELRKPRGVMFLGVDGRYPLLPEETWSDFLSHLEHRSVLKKLNAETRSFSFPEPLTNLRVERNVLCTYRWMGASFTEDDGRRWYRDIFATEISIINRTSTFKRREGRKARSPAVVFASAIAATNEGNRDEASRQGGWVHRLENGRYGERSHPRGRKEAAASVGERKVKTSRRVKEEKKNETWPTARLRRHAGYI